MYADTTLVFQSKFGKFSGANSISTAREDFIFVADIVTNQIFKFSDSGELISSIGGTGFGNQEFNTPVSLDASNGLDVLICDYLNNRIQRYDIKLNYIATFDFKTYNLTADKSKQIYYPKSISFLTTSETFVLVDAGAYRIAKLKSFDEVSLIFGLKGLSLDNLIEPDKMVRGSALDIWVLDKGTDEIINYDNYGSYVRRIKNPTNNKIKSISYYGDKIYFLNKNNLLIYNLTSKKFENILAVDYLNSEEPVDLAILKKNVCLILTKKYIYKFKIS